MARTNDGKKKNRAKKIFKKLKNFFKKQKVPKDMPPLAPIPSDFYGNGDTSEQAPETGMGSQSTSRVQSSPTNNSNANMKLAKHIPVTRIDSSRVIQVPLGPGTASERLHNHVTKSINTNLQNTATNTQTTPQVQPAPTNIYDANKKPPKRIRVTKDAPARIFRGPAKIKSANITPDDLHLNINSHPQNIATNTQTTQQGNIKVAKRK